MLFLTVKTDMIERQIAGLCDEKLLKEKLSRDFLDRMEGYLVELEDSLMNFRDVEHRGVVKKEQEIIELFYFKFMDIPLLSRMAAVAESFIDEVETLKGFDLPDEEREAVLLYNGKTELTEEKTIEYYI